MLGLQVCTTTLGDIAQIDVFLLLKNLMVKNIRKYKIINRRKDLHQMICGAGEMAQYLKEFAALIVDPG